MGQNTVGCVHKSVYVCVRGGFNEENAWPLSYHVWSAFNFLQGKDGSDGPPGQRGREGATVSSHIYCGYTGA